MGLRELRAAAQMTQEELAEKAGISRIMLSLYETGNAKPSAKAKYALAHALEVLPEQIDGTEDEIFSRIGDKLCFLRTIHSALLVCDGNEKKTLVEILTKSCESLLDAVKILQTKI